MYAVTQIVVDLVVEICGGETGLQRITEEVTRTNIHLREVILLVGRPLSAWRKPYNHVTALFMIDRLSSASKKYLRPEVTVPCGFKRALTIGLQEYQS